MMTNKKAGPSLDTFRRMRRMYGAAFERVLQHADEHGAEAGIQTLREELAQINEWADGVELSVVQVRCGWRKPGGDDADT